MVKRKRVKKRKISVSLRLPNDYTWQILAALTQDLHGYLRDDDRKRITAVIRQRDVIKLIDLSEEWGLQSINLSSGSLPEIRARYQISTLLKKFPFDDPSFDRRGRAIEKFISAEDQCKRANEILLPSLRRSSEPDTLAVFTYARGFIARVLGQIPDWDLVNEDSRHGPGATLSTIGGFVGTYHKFSSWPYDVSKAALPYAKQIIQQDERWLGALEDNYRDIMEIPRYRILDQKTFWSNVFCVEEANFVTFVPKDVRTERTIAIEPVLNLYLQLGVDGFIRKRLKLFGVNLDHGQEKNQELARVGSIDGDFATIDLASASDTVSIELCRYMLPPYWFGYLMALRSPYGNFEEQSLTYSKISSMGNGFTFALESLIFASIIFGVSKHFLGEFRHQHFAVYGDDLIVRVEIANALVYYLRKVGFTVNSDKSFFQGPVRESCGSDWFNGHLIRPVFLDKPITNLAELFAIRNRIMFVLDKYWSVEESHCISLIDKWVPNTLLGIVGPPSNEDFSSYRHIRYPYGRRRMSNSYCWKIKTLQCSPVPQSGRNLLFRRLMNQFREHDESPWARKLQVGLKGGGGHYHVHNRKKMQWCIATRVVSDWLPEYPAGVVF